MLPSPRGRSPVSFYQISQTSFFSWQLLTWFGTFTCTCTAPRGIVVGTCHLQARQPLPWGRSPVSFGQISLDLVFQGKSWDKGPSSLALPRMVHRPWPAAPDVIWHIYSHLYCSSRDGGKDLPSSREAVPTMEQVPCEFRADQPNFIFQPVAHDVIWHIYSIQHFKGILGIDLLSSGDVALTMGQVPCEFQSDQPNFIFQLAAPDVIWHIYSHLYCSSRDGDRDLPSSGKVALTMGKVSCDFFANQPGFSFSGEELRQESFQPCPAQDGASSMAGSSGCDLAQLLTPVLLLSLRDGGRDLPSSGEAAPTMEQVPCEVWPDQPNFIFEPAAPDMIWHIYSIQRCFKGVSGMDLLSSGDVVLTMGQVPCEFRRDQPSLIFQLAAPDMIWHIYWHLYCSSPLGMVVRTCHLQGRQPLPWSRFPVRFEQIGQTSFFSWWLLM